MPGLNFGNVNAQSGGQGDLVVLFVDKDFAD
jgi:hypothetical protein